MTEADNSLGAAELDLALLARRHQQDHLLNGLIREAENGGFQYGLGLLLNGMIVFGHLTRSEDMAEELDAQRQTAITAVDRPESVNESQWARRLDRYPNQSHRSVEALRAEINQLSADVNVYADEEGVDPSQLPGDLARRVITANACSHLTLGDVRIFAAGQAGPTPVKTMRIATDQIVGWWIVRTNEAGQAQLRLWITDDPGLDNGEAPADTH
jgi:hypothetical protein